MLAIVAAMNREVSSMLKEMIGDTSYGCSSIPICEGNYRGKQLMVVETGMGRSRAESAIGYILETCPVTEVLSVGLAGGLTDDLSPADVVFCSRFRSGSPQEEGEPYFSDSALLAKALETCKGNSIRHTEGTCVTSPHLVTEAGKKRELSSAFSGDVVDMESYWIAREAHRRGIPFLGIRAVSDTVNDRLPPFEQMQGSGRKVAWPAVIRYLSSHPSYLASSLRLYLNSRRAIANLDGIVASVVAAI
jgi:adenosylhomocysteine nucleosidase